MQCQPSMYVSTRVLVGVGILDFQQTAELYRRFTKSADRVGPLLLDLQKIVSKIISIIISIIIMAHAK